MTIWFDCTTSLASRGYNGIAAVESNLGAALAATIPDLRYVALRSGHLVEIDRPTLQPASVLARDTTWQPDRARRSAAGTLLQRSAAGARRAGELVRRTPHAGIGPGHLVISVGADWSGALATGLAAAKRRTGCKVITMVYDLIPLTHPHLAFHHDNALFTRYYRRLLEASDLVLCISEQTRHDLDAFARSHRARTPPVEILRLGEAAPEPGHPAGGRSSFFLVVGTIERRKNLELLYDALRVLADDDAELPAIVVAGAPGWGVDDLLREITSRSTRACRAVDLRGPVSASTLDLLYKQARALLFPSHYEGWGLPVREAAVRGCPLAAGDTPAVREAATGYDGASFLPVDDPFQWADYMRSPAKPATALPHRPWADVAQQLLRLV